ncbi:MAG: YdeI/OmpD-associated family protein [Candidatus Doudnabacteria bacterium]|nr:YdeI/OmpD-associated family protein [Candidatus Doudnabacteria bacterium]
MKNAQQVYSKDRATWRLWLGKHHGQKEGVWLVYDKNKASERALTYDALVEEALCFGWIDSTSGRVSETQAKIWVAPRNPKSNWSKSNRDRVVKLIKAKKMHVSGLVLVKLAKKTGTWDALVDVQNNVVPADLAVALAKNKKAQKHFDAFPPSSKCIILEWILNAKKPETRKVRITETVALAAKNVRANHYRQ